MMRPRRCNPVLLWQMACGTVRSTPQQHWCFPAVKSKEVPQVSCHDFPYCGVASRFFSGAAVSLAESWKLLRFLVSQNQHMFWWLTISTCSGDSQSAHVLVTHNQHMFCPLQNAPQKLLYLNRITCQVHENISCWQLRTFRVVFPQPTYTLFSVTEWQTVKCSVLREMPRSLATAVSVILLSRISVQHMFLARPGQSKSPTSVLPPSTAQHRIHTCFYHIALDYHTFKNSRWNFRGAAAFTCNNQFKIRTSTVCHISSRPAVLTL